MQGKMDGLGLSACRTMSGFRRQNIVMYGEAWIITQIVLEGSVL